MNHFMCDLETMGLGFNPAIIQISGICFDPFTGKLGKEFSIVVDLNDSMKYGTLDANTIKFWMLGMTSIKAKELVMEQTKDDGTNTNSLSYALEKLNEFIKSNNIEYVWGNGVASDNVWLRSAYEKTGVKEGFTFRDDMCLRTLRSIAKLKGWDNNSVEFDGVLHNAIDDAKYQVKVLKSIFEYLNIQ